MHGSIQINWTIEFAENEPELRLCCIKKIADAGRTVVSVEEGQFQRFADTLPQVLPVRLVQQGAVAEVIAR